MALTTRMEPIRPPKCDAFKQARSLRFYSPDMASDFTYEGIENNQDEFIEKATRMGYWLLTGSPTENEVELLDGDEVAISSGYRREIWSIRDRRVIRSG